ncbi:MAG TPA: ATP-binding protein [bacterium]|nr:ATP-binding protein [bacterium]
MKRFLLDELLKWKESSIRKSLILRGARQVGKSYLIREFGKHFDSFVEVNFEKDHNLSQIFDGDLEPQKIIEKISAAKNTAVIPGKTLLFLDEIQAVPRAVTALRYFYELMPQLHVISAGSLLEFVLEKTGMPVGRVSSMYLYPLSFKEFLAASGREMLCDYIDKHDSQNPVSEVFLDQLMTLFGEYMAVGGMPEAVSVWLEHRDLKKVSEIHHNIIDTYRQDFLKYAKNQQIHHVDKVFSAVPRMLGRKFVYSRVDETLKSREIKPALELLEMAQVVHRISHSSSNGVPLGAECNYSIFKTIFIDVGLAQAILGLSDGEWILDVKNSVVNRGEIVEAFVGTEILAYSDPHRPQKLFYWVREKQNSQAEIDFVIQKQDKVIPVEVKSGTTGNLKSMMQFLKEKPSTPYGIHISPNNFGIHNNINQIPLCAIWKMF